METEAIDSTWLAAFEYESRMEDSDITSRGLLENAERSPAVRRLTWPTAKDPVLSFAISKRTVSVEERSQIDLEEALSMAQTFFRLSTLLEGNPDRGRVFIYNATGVVNGNIPEPKINILVRVARDVIEKSKANRCWDELNAAIELAKATYTTLKKIELLLEKDPEIPDRETMRFILTVSGDPEQILEEESMFKRDIETRINPRIREIMTVTYYWG
jgi:hypothetical protein